MSVTNKNTDKNKNKNANNNINNNTDKNVNKNNQENVEITAPVGSWESLSTAIQNKADSIYFGVGNLNMRARAANNFKVSDLKKIQKECDKHGMKTYLALNIVVYDEEIKQAKKVCDKAKRAGISAIIASDISIITYANQIKMPVHISTQANVSNIDAIKFYSKYADAIVLARELDLKKIKNICDTIKKEKIKGPSGQLVKVEVFVHGALCVAVSGKCYMSLANYNHSANRGDCLQSCRRKYRVYDDETNQELTIDNQFVMSPSDLCTLTILDQIIGTGVSILKIEGRGRSPEYVQETLKAYKEALTLIKTKQFNKSKALKLKENLKKVFNRGFWEGGYYLGTKINEWSNTYGSKATQTKLYVGKIVNYYAKSNVAHALIESHPLKKGDEILIIGPTTGTVNSKLDKIIIEKKEKETAKKGENVTFIVKQKLRKNDKLYVLKKTNN